MSKYPSSQSNVQIAEIRDNIVIMRDGSLRSVLMTSSINFSLKSEQEQNATIGSYVSFLNSLSFPLQVVIQSRKLNIDEYIDRLVKVEREQTNELLRMQTKEYREYILQLVDLGNIMSKKFYVVVPLLSGQKKERSFWSRLSETLHAAVIIKLSEKAFNDKKKKLMQRVDLVATGLGNMGLNAVMLNTQNLIEMYYNSYNPKVSESQKLEDLDKLQFDSDSV